jgi:hypothetical protein
MKGIKGTNLGIYTPDGVVIKEYKDMTGWGIYLEPGQGDGDYGFTLSGMEATGPGRAERRLEIVLTENALVEMLYLIRRRFYNLPPEDEEELENDFDEYETQFSDEPEPISSTSDLSTFTWTYTEI